MKEYIEKIKIHHVLITVLLVIIAVLYFDNREFKKLLYKQQFYNNRFYDDYHDYPRRQHNMAINSRILEIEREFRRLNRDFERLNNNFIKESKRDRTREFVYNPKIKQDDKNFELILNLPRNINEEDIKVDFIDNNLTVNIEKSIEGKNSSFKSSFFESYYIPNTKATKKDIKINFNKNSLNVVVPMI